MPFPYKISISNGSNELTEYLNVVHEAQQTFDDTIVSIFEKFLQGFEPYMKEVANRELDINYSNPMLYTRKNEYVLYMLLIEYSNQIMKAAFDAAPKKIVLLPRCLTGPNFDLLRIKRTKIGWHRILGCNNGNGLAWELTELGNQHNFEVFITMGNRFKEPNFLRVFRNLRKKYGHFGLLAVACLPELALGRTYIMEVGIPTIAVPIFFSGCAKWHGPTQALPTKFPFKYLLELLNINLNSTEE
ncbi:MAG: DUF116 domain-containing protein [Candidatus Heimdallarchaeota archaeon]|nr:MAG: DUF116 domain-containing protein [Candidatus Heimdallarchaeota archaeon]